MNIHFDSININNIWANSGNFLGDNYQAFWTTQFKENSALGMIVGDYNVVSQNINVVYDNDGIDSPFSSQSPGNASPKKGK